MKKYLVLVAIVFLVIPFFGVVKAVTTTNLTSYWKLDEASGSRADSHGSNTLTDNNTVGSGTGIINSAADFERALGSEYLSITNASQTGLDGLANFSISFWANVEDAPASGEFYGLVSFDEPSPFTGDDRVFEMYYSNDGTNTYLQFFVFQTFEPTQNYTQVRWNVNLGTATWNHLVFTFDGSQSAATDKIKGYRNGSAMTVTSSGNVGAGASSSANAGNDAFFAVGSLPEGIASYEYDGLIDEVGFWARTLSSTDVSDLYNSGAGLAYPFSAAPADDTYFEIIE